MVHDAATEHCRAFRAPQQRSQRKYRHEGPLKFSLDYRF